MTQVDVAQLRRELEDWLGRARAGEQVVITDRGIPVAKLVGVDRDTSLDRLVDDGAIGPAPPTPRRKITGHDRPRPHGDVSDLVIRERNARR